MAQYNEIYFSGRLKDVDPAVAELVDIEAERQVRKIIMIASESLCPESVRQALASEFGNIYAEGYPSTRMSRWENRSLDDQARQLSFFRRYADRRYYKGTEYCDFVESLAQMRCAEAFSTDEVPAQDIYVNVQPLSGAAANNAVYEALVPHGGVVMGMALPHGGHLTHGSDLNRSGKTYRIVTYEVDPRTRRLDYDRIRALAEEHDPAMIIAGYSAYPWAVDWTKFREAADAAPSGAVLFADVAHTAGLIAGGAYPSPVGYADVIAFTTHKTLCGPRGAVILSSDPDVAKLVDAAVFPGEQGGPHLHTIAAKAVSFGLARTPAFRELQKRTVENAKALAAGFQKRGVPLAYGGTDSHLLLVDLNRYKTKSKEPLRADAVSRVLDICGLVLNKNTIAGDEKALQPSGLRFGTTVATQRGMGPAEMDSIADVVTDLLAGMTSLEVVGLGGPVGRVRVPLDLLEKTRARIADLAGRGSQDAYGYPHFEGSRCDFKEIPDEVAGYDRETAALEDGCVAFHNSDGAHILVRGERAAAMLQGVCTSDVLTLEPDESVPTLLLDPDGTVRHNLRVTRLPDGADGFPRLALQAGPGSREALLLYLRSLSDGYIDAGGEDPYVKIEGPAVIEDLMLGRDGGWTSLTLAGPRAAEILGAVCHGGADAQPQQRVPFQVGGKQAWAVLEASGVAQVFVEGLGLSALEAGCVEAGAVQGGGRCRTLWMGRAGCPTVGSPAPLPKNRALALVDLTKTFFVGQTALLQRAPKAPDSPAYAFEEPKPRLRRTPLFEIHEALGAKMVPFAGWEMPVVYTSISEEHAAVRNTAGLFDVGHMGVFEASGPHALRFLDLATSNYVRKLRVGESQYSYLLDPQGGVIDDLMIYYIAHETYMVVVNAVNAEKDWDWLKAVNEGRCLLDPGNPAARLERPCRLRNLKDPSTGPDMKIDIALQGPASLQILCDAADGATLAGLHHLGKSENLSGRLEGIPVIISRTGYTGEEYGYEIYVHPDRAVDLWNAVWEAGEPHGIKPTGLGARDSTRTEAGLPLYGHELAGEYDINPVEAGYGHFVKWHKPFFVGRRALLDRVEARKRELIRFEAVGQGRRLAKTTDPVINRKDKVIGYVTSCALAGEQQVGLAIVDRRQARPGARIAFFSLPRKGPSISEKARDNLALGDPVTVPIEATIIDRFP